MELPAPQTFLAIVLGRQDGFEGSADGVELPQSFELGIVSRKSAVVRVELDGADEEGDRFVNLVAQREDRGQHIERVILVGRVVGRPAEMLDRFVVVARVDGKRGGEDAFLGC